MSKKDMLIHLSDLIDMHDYNDNWEKEAQEMITKLASSMEDN